MSAVRVADIERAIASAFPLERAEQWDRNGLLAGDPQAEVTGVMLALDPTLTAVSEAALAGANVLVTHHPAYLEPPQRLVPGRGPGGVLFAALDAGVALVNAHTNLDRAPQAQRLLPDALGLEALKPLERSTMPLALITVYVPDNAAESVTAAMAGAGAGRIGDYEDCSFSMPGTGAFTPGPATNPCEGERGVASVASEVRIEMVAPRHLARGVVSAAVAAHPYEEPLVTVTDVEIARNAARLGMVSSAPQGMTLRGLATVAAGTFNITPRVWGDPDAPVSRVATSTGSAGSLVGDAFAAGAQVLLAGEVRYHEALDASEAGLGIIELGHDVSEWPLVGLLERVVRSVPGIDPDMVRSLPASPGWWTT